MKRSWLRSRRCISQEGGITESKERESFKLIIIIGVKQEIRGMKTEPHLLKLALRDFSWSGDGEARFQ